MKGKQNKPSRRHLTGYAGETGPQQRHMPSWGQRKEEGMWGRVPGSGPAGSRGGREPRRGSSLKRSSLECACSLTAHAWGRAGPGRAWKTWAAACLSAEVWLRLGQSEILGHHWLSTEGP